MRYFFTITLFFVFSQMTIGQELLIFDKFDDFEKAIVKKDNNVYVLNFWATWCAPCVKELPYFENLHQANKNLKVILVSLDSKSDFDKKMMSFIAKKKITAQIVSLSDKDYNSWLNKIDKDWSGAIPATYIFSGDRKLFAEREFESFAELNDYVNTFTNPK